MKKQDGHVFSIRVMYSVIAIAVLSAPCEAGELPGLQWLSTTPSSRNSFMTLMNSDFSEIRFFIQIQN